MMPAFNDHPEKPGRRRTPKRKWKRKRPRQGGRSQGGMSLWQGSSQRIAHLCPMSNQSGHGHA